MSDYLLLEIGDRLLQEDGSSGLLDESSGGTPPSSAPSDALSRRSAVAVILPFLRGGIIPTGADLNARERQYVTGLYAPAPVIVGDLALLVADAVSVIDRGYHVPPESVLVPVLIPSYRRRRMA